MYQDLVEFYGKCKLDIPYCTWIVYGYDDSAQQFINNPHLRFCVKPKTISGVRIFSGIFFQRQNGSTSST